MISLATMAANPGMWSNPVTGAVAAASAVGSVALSQIGKGRRAAKKFVSGFEDPFGQELARISAIAETDPEAAAEQLRFTWNKFYSDAQGYIAKGGNDAKVARQALSNPDLMSTVDRLAAQLGIPSVRSGGATVATAPVTMPDVSAFSGNPQGTPLSQIGQPSGKWGALRLPDFTGGRGTARTTPTFPGGSPQPGTTSTSGSGKTSPSTPNQQNAIWEAERIIGRDLDGDGKIGGQSGTHGFNWLQDAIVPAAITGGLNIVGGWLGSRAAKQAAKILSDAGLDAAKLLSETTDKVLAQQKGIYEQSRQDMMPWLNTGKVALGELGRRMGLPSDQGMPLAAMSNGGGIPDFDAEAERYRQGRMVS